VLAVISIYLSIKVVRYDTSRQGKKVLNEVFTFSSKNPQFDNFGSNENSGSEMESTDEPPYGTTQNTLNEPLLPETPTQPVKKANPYYQRY
jgi:hypothetical protein